MGTEVGRWLRSHPVPPVPACQGPGVGGPGPRASGPSSPVLLGHRAALPSSCQRLARPRLRTPSACSALKPWGLASPSPLCSSARHPRGLGVTRAARYRPTPGDPCPPERAVLLHPVWMVAAASLGLGGGVRSHPRRLFTLLQDEPRHPGFPPGAVVVGRGGGCHGAVGRVAETGKLAPPAR